MPLVDCVVTLQVFELFAAGQYKRCAGELPPRQLFRAFAHDIYPPPPLLLNWHIAVIARGPTPFASLGGFDVLGGVHLLGQAV